MYLASILDLRRTGFDSIINLVMRSKPKIIQFDGESGKIDIFNSSFIIYPKDLDQCNISDLTID
jgi:hypothetical protein